MVFEKSSTATHVRSATQQDQPALHQLLQYETYSHRHMDWKSPLDWLGKGPFLVAVKYQRPAALIACPPDPPEVAWIRAFASSSLISRKDAWDTLWKAARERLLQEPETEKTLAIVMDDWFRELLVSSGFHKLTDVVMLSWEASVRQPPAPDHPVAIRPMDEADLPAVAVLDRAAFRPVWHHSEETLRLALAQSLVATVSEDAGGITGYQISTPSPFGGHLARLAVHPERQGHGIGYGLLYDLLQRFQTRGALRVTVNTQEDNPASLAIYKKARFHLTGESYPIYEYDLRK